MEINNPLQTHRAAGSQTSLVWQTVQRHKNTHIVVLMLNGVHENKTQRNVPVGRFRNSISDHLAYSVCVLSGVYFCIDNIQLLLNEFKLLKLTACDEWCASVGRLQFHTNNIHAPVLLLIPIYILYKRYENYTVYFVFYQFVQLGFH